MLGDGGTLSAELVVKTINKKTAGLRDVVPGFRGGLFRRVRKVAKSDY